LYKPNLGSTGRVREQERGEHVVEDEREIARQLDIYMEDYNTDSGLQFPGARKRRSAWAVVLQRVDRSNGGASGTDETMVMAVAMAERIMRTRRRRIEIRHQKYVTASTVGEIARAAGWNETGRAGRWPGAGGCACR